MLTHEWNMEEALAYRFQEGLEEGLEKGLEEGLEKGRTNEREAILRLMRQVNSLEQLEQILTKPGDTKTAEKN